jgi:hypothetical protein
MLSPIDPSINHTLAPQVVGAPIGTRASVSVEAIKGYLKSVTRSAFTLMAHTSRACEAEPSDALRDQTDPLEPGWAALRQFLFRDFFSARGAPTRRRRSAERSAIRPTRWPPSPFLEFGLGAGAAAAASDSMVWSAAPGERSEVRGRRQQPARNRTDTGGALTFMAPNPRAREAVKPNRPTNPHSGPGQPGARQRSRSPERPAIGPTCTRRLNLAAVLADVASFLELGRSGRTRLVCGGSIADWSPPCYSHRYCSRLNKLRTVSRIAYRISDIDVRCHRAVLAELASRFDCAFDLPRRPDSRGLLAVPIFRRSAC